MSPLWEKILILGVVLVGWLIMAQANPKNRGQAVIIIGIGLSLVLFAVYRTLVSIYG